MIRIENVTKRYYNFTAIDQVSLEIPRGEVVGILGPNGAGKSTLFKLVAGLLKPDGGRILPLNGRVWPKIGYKPDRLLMPNHLRVSQYLEMAAHLSNIPSSQVQKTVFEALVRVDLVSAANKRIRDCSKGMRQRVGLAQALIGEPPLLLLDEPSNGLDPAGQSEMNARIQELHAEGKTILISSHQLDDMTKTCTELVILKNGRVHYQNNINTALAIRSHTVIETDQNLDEDMKIELLALHEDVDIEGFRVILRGDAMALRRHIITRLLTNGYDVLHVQENKLSLNQIYSEVTA